MAAAPATALPGVYTVADLFLECLAQVGVEYIFSVLGSDHPSIIEAYTRRQKEGKEEPKLLIFLHEFVALSAADGYGRLTQRPQCVLVHVDVGTAALGQGLHNASSGRAPVLIFAGTAPLTLHGELPGSRSEHVQWYQDVPNQAAIVAPYSRYSAEVKCAEHVQVMVERAAKMAGTGSMGPAYLMGSREVLATGTEVKVKAGRRWGCEVGGLPPQAVEVIADALLGAERPLVVTGYLGRKAEAVEKLVQLVDLAKTIRVFDFEFREMSFPTGHPAWLSRATGAALAIKSADVIVVLDADVPWIPTKVKPSDRARIFHIDIDPRKEKMVLFDIGAEATFAADCSIALDQLCTRLRNEPALQSKSFEGRFSSIEKAHHEGRLRLEARAAPREDGKLTKDFLFRTLGQLVPTNTIWVSDVVTNQVPLSEQLSLNDPKTNFTKGGSGLGWAGGAAIGIKLAADAGYHSYGSMVCCITGDGSFVFGAPSAVYWAQYQHKTPFLTVVVNNGGWKATRSCINDVHPQGLAARVSDEGLGIDLRGDGPDYLGIAKAAANGHLVTARVTEVGKLEETVNELVRVVWEEGKGAVLDAVIV